MTNPIEKMTANDLLIFLTDALLMRSSVTGNIVFGTDDEALEDLLNRCQAGNDDFSDLIHRVAKVTGRSTSPDPRDIRRALYKKQANDHAFAIAAKHQ